MRDYKKILEERIEKLYLNDRLEDVVKPVFQTVSDILDDNKAMFIFDISKLLLPALQEKLSHSYEKKINILLTHENRKYGRRYGIKIKSFSKAIDEVYDHYDKIIVAKNSRHGNRHENIMYKNDAGLIDFVKKHTLRKEVVFIELIY